MRIYRPAVLTDADRLLALWRSARFKMKALPSLTFVAEEDGTVEAALGLNFEDTTIIAGPLVVAPEAKTKRLMILRLIESMEAWIVQAGVTAYLFSIPLANKRWNGIIQHFGLTPYATKNGSRWYVREMTNGRRRT